LSLGFTGGASRFEARGPMYVPAANFKQLASFLSTDALGANVGAGITLGGVFQDSSVTSFAQIAGIKENATSGDYGGALALYTRPNGDTLQERARITSGGDLLVGRTSVSISGVKVDAEGLFGSIKSGNWSWSFGASASTNAFVINDTTTGSSVERARIDSSGNLLVGTTSQVAAGFVSVLFNGATRQGIALGLTANTSDATYALFRDNSGNTCGLIQRVGTTSAVLYTTTSDYRLKTVVGAVTGHGARIDALEPIEYTWNSNGLRSRGFLAHKFQEVYANSVNGTKDAVDADGNPKYQAMQAATSEVIADLVAEIQSLRKRLADAGI
jgi:hypothetical protein